MPEIPFLSEATFERLLNRGHYGIIGNQLLFYSADMGKFVLTQISDEQEYTANDYAQLPESAPFQLINGKLIFMASPKITHQRISMRLIRFIDNYVNEHKLGELFHAPCDVYFDDKNVVQPDLLFVSIARKSRIQDYIQGAPDFVVEVLSPSNTKAEMQAKLELYGKYDVLEYWIVKPNETCIDVYHAYKQQMGLFANAGINDTIKSVAIEGFELEVRRLFE